jgi:hypothetical protein
MLKACIESLIPSPGILENRYRLNQFHSAPSHAADILIRRDRGVCDSAAQVPEYLERYKQGEAALSVHLINFGVIG